MAELIIFIKWTANSGKAWAVLFKDDVTVCFFKYDVTSPNGRL